jgi:hypothetical protein
VQDRQCVVEALNEIGNEARNEGSEVARQEIVSDIEDSTVLARRKLELSGQSLATSSSRRNEKKRNLPLVKFKCGLGRLTDDWCTRC